MTEAQSYHDNRIVLLRTRLRQVELLSERSHSDSLSCDELVQLTNAMTGLTETIAHQMHWLDVSTEKQPKKS